MTEEQLPKSVVVVEVVVFSRVNSLSLLSRLNIDGVIVGNYRCSLAAVDLNRQYVQFLFFFFFFFLFFLFLFFVFLSLYRSFDDGNVLNIIYRLALVAERYLLLTV